MKHLLHLSTVLVLNRNWQAIHVKTPADAFCMMASGSATGLDVQGDDHIIPVSWEGWLTLPVREDDNRVNTPRGPVRVPTVIVAANYAKVPLCRPRFSSRGIWERDGGICQACPSGIWTAGGNTLCTTPDDPARSPPPE